VSSKPTQDVARPTSTGRAAPPTVLPVSPTASLSSTKPYQRPSAPAPPCSTTQPLRRLNAQPHPPRDQSAKHPSQRVLEQQKSLVRHNDGHGTTRQGHDHQSRLSNRPCHTMIGGGGGEPAGRDGRALEELVPVGFEKDRCLYPACGTEIGDLMHCSTRVGPRALGRTCGAGTDSSARRSSRLGMPARLVPDVVTCGGESPRHMALSQTSGLNGRPVRTRRRLCGRAIITVPDRPG